MSFEILSLTDSQTDFNKLLNVIKWIFLQDNSSLGSECTGSCALH